MPGKLINGPRNILYTVNGGATAYTSNINNAAYNWMYTGAVNPIYMSPVSSNVGSTLDMYFYNEASTTVAYTSFFNKNDVQQDWRTDYWWNKILINDKYKYDYSVNHDAILAYEMGHMLGLDDVYAPSDASRTIMYGYGNLMQVFKPTISDSEEIVGIYGRY